MQAKPAWSGAEAPQTGLKTEIITEFAGLERLAEDWNRLWRAAPRRHVFLSFSWARAWWRAYGAAHEVFAPVVSDGARVVGILPMVREGTALHFFGSPDADYTDILCGEERSAEVIEAAFEAIFDTARAWTRCTLDNLPEESRIARHIGALPDRMQRRLGLIRKASCPAIVGGAAGDAYAPLVRKDSIRRHTRKLERLGEPRFHHLEKRAEILELLPLFVRQNIARRAMAGGRSVLLAPETVAFYRCLVEELDPRRELRFSVLLAGSTPLAFHLGFELAGRFIWYKPSFDIDYWDWSPGEVLIGKLLEYAGAGGIPEFDFTLGDEAFKYRFANVVRALYTLKLYPAGIRGRGAGCLDRIKEAAKQRPRAFALAKELAGRARSYGVKASLGRAGRLVFAHEKALVFRANYPAGDAPQTTGLEIAEASLSELALLSTECPGRISAEDLARARAQIKRGDVCYIARRGGRVVQTAWMEAGREMALPGGSIVLPEGAAALFDTAGADAAAIREMMRARRAQAGSFWTSCDGSQKELRRALEEAGFRLAGRSAQIRIFGITLTRGLPRAEPS